MSWRLKILLLLVAAVPAFTGYPLGRFTAEVVPGARAAWVFYAAGIHILVRAAVGARAYGTMLSIAAVVALPVVMTGGAVSCLLLVATGGGLAGIFVYSPHYVALCLTLLTVVPLALALVTVLPFGRFEQGLLSQAGGVGRVQKALLMAVRVFNHVAFSVIPGILEVIREERLFSRAPSHERPRRVGVTQATRSAVRAMVHVSVDAICSSVQYIPLWAVEIAQLPETGPSGPDDPRTPGKPGAPPRVKEQT